MIATARAFAQPVMLALLFPLAQSLLGAFLLLEFEALALSVIARLFSILQKQAVLARRAFSILQARTCFPFFSLFPKQAFFLPAGLSLPLTRAFFFSSFCQRLPRLPALSFLLFFPLPLLFPKAFLKPSCQFLPQPLQAFFRLFSLSRPRLPKAFSLRFFQPLCRSRSSCPQTLLAQSVSRPLLNGLLLKESTRKWILKFGFLEFGIQSLSRFLAFLLRLMFQAFLLLLLLPLFLQTPSLVFSIPWPA